MTRQTLPEPVGRFLDGNVYSVSDLETLLWLRARRDRAVEVADLGRALGMVPWQVGLVLGRLAEKGLVVPAAGDRWSCRDAAGSVEDVLDWLGENLGRYRVAVTARIFAKPAHADGEDR
jgi:hypothetical protein